MKRSIYILGALGAWGIAVALFFELLLSDQPEMSVIGGMVFLLVGLGAAARAYGVRVQAQEREVTVLRDDLRAQVHLTAAQQERNRLARDLHDSIKQQLFSIQMSAAAAQARWESDPPGAQQAIGDVRRDAHEALVEMTALLQQLSPAPLEKVGLVQALRDQCEALGYRAGAEVTADIGALPDDAAFPPGAQEALFRIAQEALSNVARHARAAHVTLALAQTEEGGQVVLEIRDDGQGFDLAAAPAGMGLANIRQRVSALGGTLDVQSAPGAGTTLRVTVPPRPAPVVDRATPLLNRVILTGLLGGLALIAALFYPLYVLVPSGVIPGWMTGSPALGVLCGVLAAGLAVGTGYVAAVWSGLRRPAFGALAGATAGLLAYMGIGATAAGMPPLAWLQTPHPAWLMEAAAAAIPPEDTFYLIILGAMIMLMQGAFWGALLGGAGLGAVGGWLAARRRPATELPDIRRPLTLWLTLSAILSGLFLFFILLTLNSMGGNAVPPAEVLILTWPAFLLYSGQILPLSTALLLYLTASAGLYVLLRHAIRQGTHAALGRAQIMAVLLGSYSLWIVGFVLSQLQILFYFTVVWRALLGGLLFLCAGLGGLYWLSLLEVRRRWRALGLGRMHVPQILATLYLPVSLLLLFIVMSDSLTHFTVWKFLLVLGGGGVAWVALWRRPLTPLLGPSAASDSRAALDAVGLGALLAGLTPIAPYLILASTSFLWLDSSPDVAFVQQSFLHHAIATGVGLIVGMALVGLSILVLDGIMALGRLGGNGGQ